MPLELVENAKYLGMTINSDISWDFHVQRLCQNMYYHLSLLRRLRRIFPRDLLLQVYKSYVQPRLDCGITLYGCSTQKNIEDRMWNYTSPRCVKSLIGTVSCIWVANCGMIFPSLYKILQTLNHSNVIIICPNCSLTPDWFNSFALVFAICQVLCDEMIVPYFLSSSLCTLMWMDFCISYCIYHTGLCFSF